MERYEGQLIRKIDDEETGNAAVGVGINVYQKDGVTPATVYAVDNTSGTMKNQPFDTDDDGRFWFYAPNGEYWLTFDSGDDPLNIYLFDPADFNPFDEIYIVNSEAEMLALSQASPGAFAVRTDEANAIYMLAELPASDISNWTLLNLSAGVVSWNGLSGVVNADYGNMPGNQDAVFQNAVGVRGTTTGAVTVNIGSVDANGEVVLGDTQAHTTIHSNLAPTWWDGSSVRTVVFNANNIGDAGNGVPVFDSKSGANLLFKRLLQSGNITVTDDGNGNIIIGNAGLDGVVTLNDLAGTVDIVPGTSNVTIDATSTPGEIAINVDEGSGGGTRSGFWQYATDTTMVDPGAGNFRSDAAPNTSTQLAFSITTDNAIDAKNILDTIQEHDVIYLQDVTDSSNWVRYRVTSDATDNTTWFQISVAFEDGEGSVAKGAQMLVRFAYATGVTAVEWQSAGTPVLSSGIANFSSNFALTDDGGVATVDVSNQLNFSSSFDLSIGGQGVVSASSDGTNTLLEFKYNGGNNFSIGGPFPRFYNGFDIQGSFDDDGTRMADGNNLWSSSFPKRSVQLQQFGPNQGNGILNFDDGALFRVGVFGNEVQNNPELSTQTSVAIENVFRPKIIPTSNTSLASQSGKTGFSSFFNFEMEGGDWYQDQAYLNAEDNSGNKLLFGSILSNGKILENDDILAPGFASVNNGALVFHEHGSKSTTFVQQSNLNFIGKTCGNSTTGNYLTLQSGNVYVSSDSGANWTSVQDIGTGDDCIEKIGSTLFAVDGSTPSRIMRSTDETTWTEVHVLSGFADFGGMATDGTNIIAVFSISDDVVAFLSSDDGLNWSEITSLPALNAGWTSGAKPTIAYANGTFVIAGSDASTFNAVAVTSTDGGANWTSPSIITSESSARYAKVVAAGTGFLAGTNGFVGSVLFESSDGVSWSESTVDNPYGGWILENANGAIYSFYPGQYTYSKSTDGGATFIGGSGIHSSVTQFQNGNDKMFSGDLPPIMGISRDRVIQLDIHHEQFFDGPKVKKPHIDSSDTDANRIAALENALLSLSLVVDDAP